MYPTEHNQPDNQPPWRAAVPHRFTFELFRLVELDSQPQEAQRWNDAESETNAPSCTKVVFGSDQNEDHGHEGCYDESDVDLNVGEHDEPSVTMASLQFTGALGASHTSSGIFTTIIPQR